MILLALALSATGYCQSSVVNRQSRLPDDTLPVITLADALERSVRLNPDYVASLGSVAETEWSHKMARVAFLVPAVSASLDYVKYSQAFFNIGTFEQSSTSSTFQLTARYDVNLRKFTELGRTAAELERATATEVQRRFAAALLVESAYYIALVDQGLDRVTADRVVRAEEQLALARARVATGAAVQSDSLTVRIELSRAQVARVRQQAQLRVSQLELGRRVGLAGPAGAAELDTAPPPPLPVGLDAAIAQALEQGPAYRAARARERAAQSALKGRRSDFFPTLTLGGSHSRFDIGLFPNASNVSAISVTASFNIWNNGDRELEIKRAATERNVARAVRSDLELASSREVTEAYDGYETARAEVELTGMALAAARENYRVQEARYRAGATTVLDLLLVQNDLSQQEEALVRARSAARLARARLEAILGMRLETSQGGGQ